jgi:hypothetical protein
VEINTLGNLDYGMRPFPQHICLQSARKRIGTATTDQVIGLARYLFLPGMGAAGLTCVTATGDAGTADFDFGCLGFLYSRLPRGCPLAILSS